MSEKAAKEKNFERPSKRTIALRKMLQYGFLEAKHKERMRASKPLHCIVYHLTKFINHPVRLKCDLFSAEVKTEKKSDFGCVLHSHDILTCLNNKFKNSLGHST